MNLSTISRRVAATGAATALAAGALVGATATGAQAATGQATYTCPFPIIGETAIPVQTTIPDISQEFPTVPAGLPINPGLLTADYVFSAPAGLVALLGGVTDPGAVTTFNLGDIEIPVSNFAFDLAGATPIEGGGLAIPASASNGVFSLPEAGVYDLTAPSSFDFTALVGGNPISVPCTTADAPQVLDTLTVVKNPSTTDAKAPKKVRKGKRATVRSIVTGGYNAATGDVVAMKGTKTIGQGVLAEDGTANFKLDRLKVGKHTIAVKYLGDGFREASKDSVVIKVVRPRR